MKSVKNCIKLLALVAIFSQSTVQAHWISDFFSNAWKNNRNTVVIASGIGAIILAACGIYWYSAAPQSKKSNNENKQKSSSPASNADVKVSPFVGSDSQAGILKADPEHINEDAIFVDEQNQIYGVFDGNGKTKKVLVKECANLNSCSQDTAKERIESYGNYKLESQFDPAELAQRVATELPKSVAKAGKDQKAIQEAFDTMQKTVRPHCIMGTGTTAVVAHITTDEGNGGKCLVVANLGDSKAVLYGRESLYSQLSQDHKINKVIGGDTFDKSQVYVVKKNFNGDEFLVLMSDGVSNILPLNEIGTFIRKGFAAGKLPKIIATELLVHVRNIEKKRYDVEAQKNEYAKIDDSSIIIIKLRR